MTHKHALIVDDNVKNVNVLARLLEGQGVSHSSITNPHRLDSAIQSLEQLDVVFLDLEMPGLDGFQVLDSLKADDRFTGIPIVAYTVHVSEIKVAHERGFDSFIGKPLDFDKFPGQLSRILNGQAVWETA